MKVFSIFMETPTGVQRFPPHFAPKSSSLAVLNWVLDNYKLHCSVKPLEKLKVM